MALNIENIIAEIKEASILELNDLVKAIEEEDVYKRQFHNHQDKQRQMKKKRLKQLVRLASQFLFVHHTFWVDVYKRQPLLVMVWHRLSLVSLELLR